MKNFYAVRASNENDVYFQSKQCKHKHFFLYIRCRKLNCARSKTDFNAVARVIGHKTNTILSFVIPIHMYDIFPITRAQNILLYALQRSYNNFIYISILSLFFFKFSFYSTIIIDDGITGTDRERHFFSSTPEEY